MMEGKVTCILDLGMRLIDLLYDLEKVLELMGRICK
jgi:hypothetical protein